MRAVHPDNKIRVFGQVHHLRKASSRLSDLGVCELLQHPAFAHGAGSPSADSRRAGGGRDADDGSDRSEIVRGRLGEIV